MTLSCHTGDPGAAATPRLASHYVIYFHCEETFCRTLKVPSFLSCQPSSSEKKKPIHTISDINVEMSRGKRSPPHPPSSLHAWSPQCPRPLPCQPAPSRPSPLRRPQPPPGCPRVGCSGWGTGPQPQQAGRAPPRRAHLSRSLRRGLQARAPFLRVCGDPAALQVPRPPRQCPRARQPQVSRTRPRMWATSWATTATFLGATSATGEFTSF